MNCSHNIAELAEEIRLRKGSDSRAAGRLMSLAEESPEKTIELLRELSSFTEPRIVLGITGAPGSGKSMLAGRLIENFRQKYPDRMIGIVAVDPSSPRSGGSILGDRIRMMQHADDPKVFIRSIASHGQKGGVTLGTTGIISVMGAIGCDLVIVETVGVGQMEFAVKEVSDVVAVVLAPGQGDTMQFLKAGLMEIGDVFVVNKSDCPESTPFRAQLLNALFLRGRDPNMSVFSTSARDNLGMAELLDFIEDYAILYLSERQILRGKQRELLIKQAVFFEFQKRLDIAFEKKEPDMARKILNGEISLSSSVDSLIRKMK